MAHTDVNNAFCRILALLGMSEYFILPSVSTQLLLREGVDVPDHLLHLSDVSSLFLSEDSGQLRSVSWLFCGRFAHGSSLGTCDDSGCNLLVDGVCTVGRNRLKVPAALEAVKVTLDAAGLQCSEVEADKLLSLEASRIWRLRRGLEFAARLRHLTGDQVAKLTEHITWSCLLRRHALSLINAGYRFARTFGPRCRRVWPAVVQEFRWIASLLPLLTCNLASPRSLWVYATDASGGARGGHASQK